MRRRTIRVPQVEGFGAGRRRRGGKGGTALPVSARKALAGRRAEDGLERGGCAWPPCRWWPLCPCPAVSVGRRRRRPRLMAARVTARAAPARGRRQLATRPYRPVKRGRHVTVAIQSVAPVRGRRRRARSRAAADLIGLASRRACGPQRDGWPADDGMPVPRACVMTASESGARTRGTGLGPEARAAETVTK